MVECIRGIWQGDRRRLQDKLLLSACEKIILLEFCHVQKAYNEVPKFVFSHSIWTEHFLPGNFSASYWLQRSN